MCYTVGMYFLIHPLYNSLHLWIPNYHSILTLVPLLLANHKSVLCVKISLCHIWDCTVIPYSISLSLSDFLSLFCKLKVHTYCWKWLNLILCCGWVVHCCVYVPHLLDPVTYHRTRRLFPCLGCCEECFYEHSGACMSLNDTFVWVSISVLLTMPKPLTVCITANWKILKEMGKPDPLSCLLRNLYAGQEATLRTGYQQQTASK